MSKECLQKVLIEKQREVDEIKKSLNNLTENDDDEMVKNLRPTSF